MTKGSKTMTTIRLKDKILRFTVDGSTNRVDIEDVETVEVVTMSKAAAQILLATYKCILSREMYGATLRFEKFIIRLDILDHGEMEIEFATHEGRSLLPVSLATPDHYGDFRVALESVAA